ncbi:class I SAM-dependent methyltransferase [Kineosporia succinea]|uniref:SAM-dependent methyltransferase n=1 Tax=Kineosporia succinea TaxID=84632 RepID=A0ABT9P2D0_9ACTN|nr:class I SAM-dependent methyltransferase [Kineosporia succinea]MDP9826836.1 SAM-dependent methyltransferase [Kineosporia succinea]
MSEQLRRLAGRRGQAAVPDLGAELSEADARLLEQAQAREKLEQGFEAFPPRTERIGQHIKTMLGKSGVKSGRILEIGGRANPYKDWFPGFEYTALDLEITEPGVIQGDITNIPELESGSFDAIISVDVFEHIREPWLAAPEIVRLLRPGGFTYHSTVFSWRYRPSPVDYWRFSPEALAFLFKDLRIMQAQFDTVERRRSIVGKGKHKLANDAFGGWRENWRVFYAGVKDDPNAAKGVSALAAQQAAEAELKTVRDQPYAPDAD